MLNGKYEGTFDRLESLTPLLHYEDNGGEVALDNDSAAELAKYQSWFVWDRIKANPEFGGLSSKLIRIQKLEKTLSENPECDSFSYIGDDKPDVFEMEPGKFSRTALEDLLKKHMVEYYNATLGAEAKIELVIEWSKKGMANLATLIEPGDGSYFTASRNAYEEFDIIIDAMVIGGEGSDGDEINKYACLLLDNPSSERIEIDGALYDRTFVLLRLTTLRKVYDKKHRDSSPDTK